MNQMSHLYQDLRIKQEAKKVEVSMYQADFLKLQRLLEFLNKDKKSDFGLICEEDIINRAFSTMDTVEGFADYLAANPLVLSGPKMRKTKTSSSKNQSEESGEERGEGAELN